MSTNNEGRTRSCETRPHRCYGRSNRAGRDEPFRGTVISRKSAADLIAKTIRAPELHSRTNLGVNKPNTDADKPCFM